MEIRLSINAAHRLYKVAMRRDASRVWEVMESYRTKRAAEQRVAAWLEATPDMVRQKDAQLLT